MLTRMMGRGAATALLIGLLFLIALLVVMVPSLSPSLGGQTGNTTAVAWAQAEAAHLHCQQSSPPQLVGVGDCLNGRLQVPRDVWYDATFPPAISAWAAQHCAGCAAWENGNFQCVALVIGAYALTSTPLPVTTQNADQYWATFAHRPGWLEIPAGGVPLPGDIMVWAGGTFGHLSIVTAVDLTLHTVTFAQADGQAPVQTLSLRPNLTVNTFNGYWNAFTVVGSIRATPGV
jgi:CHAP domain